MGNEWVRSAPGGAYVAAAANVAVIVFATFLGAGAPPVESTNVVTLTTAQAWWLGALWVVSVVGMWQAYASLHSKRRDAERARDQAVAARDKALLELEKKRANQVLSDWLSEQWDFGIHELLNKPPEKDNHGAFLQWEHRVHEWKERVLSGLTERGATIQDWRRVNTLGLFPTYAMHPNPGVAHSLSMLVERLNRVAVVAEKYGD